MVYMILGVILFTAKERKNYETILLGELSPTNEDYEADLHRF